MGYQIIHQPGSFDPQLFAVFSSYTDTIVLYDATVDEVEEFFVELAVRDARRDVRRVLDAVAGGRPREAYYQFTRTWEEALADDREHGGEAWEYFANQAERNQT